MKKVRLETLAIAIIGFEVLLAALHQMTIGKQLDYYGYVSIHDGIRYGLIALNPLRFYPLILIILGVILAGVFWGFIKNTKTAFVLSAVQIFLVLGGVVYAFGSASGEMRKRLDIGSNVYYLVSRSEAEYGENSYLLECDGPWGSCIVLGSMHGPRVELEYEKDLQIISLQSTSEGRKEFRISSP